MWLTLVDLKREAVTRLFISTKICPEGLGRVCRPGDARVYYVHPPAGSPIYVNWDTAAGVDGTACRGMHGTPVHPHAGKHGPHTGHSLLRPVRTRPKSECAFNIIEAFYLLAIASLV